MKQEKELIKNTFIIALGKFSTQIVSFLLLRLYTGKLTKAEYGLYDIIITAVIFITPFITLTLEESMFRFLIDAKEKKEKKSIITQTIVIVSSMLIVGCVIIFLVIKIFKIETTGLFIPYVIAVVLMALMNSLVRGLGKIKLYSLSNFILSVMTIVLNVLFLLKTSLKVDGLLLSVIISNLMIVVFLANRLKILKYIDMKSFNRKLTIDMLRYSIPLIPNSLSWTVINLSDRFIVKEFLGLDSDGIYAISYKFPTLINTVYNYFAISWKESAAKALHVDGSDKYYNKIYTNLRNIVYSATVGVIAAAPFMFGVLIDPGFDEAYKYIPILVLSVYFSNMAGFYNGIFSAYKKSTIIGTTTFVAAVVNVLINLMFIKIWGIYAAAFSTLIASFIMYAYRKQKIKEFVKLRHTKKLGVSIITTVVVILAYYSNNTIFQAIGFIWACIYALVMNKTIVRGFIEKIHR